jgi:hypothetical protein
MVERALDVQESLIVFITTVKDFFISRILQRYLILYNFPYEILVLLFYFYKLGII